MPPPNILVVEDDEVFRYAMRRYLEAKGYSVVDVPSSTEGLREIGKAAFDVAILDIELSPQEPHGAAFARMMRSKHRTARFLFVTGRKDIKELEPHLPGEVLFKPVELADLHQKVQALLAT